MVQFTESSGFKTEKQSLEVIRSRSLFLRMNVMHCFGYGIIVPRIIVPLERKAVLTFLNRKSNRMVVCRVGNIYYMRFVLYGILWLTYNKLVNVCLSVCGRNFHKGKFSRRHEPYVIFGLTFSRFCLFTLHLLCDFICLIKISCVISIYLCFLHI